jgi:hypothetical protein
MKNHCINIGSFVKIVFLTVFLSSCWAPRCPIQNCHSKYEHKHSDQVLGIFSSRKFPSLTFHFLWDKKNDNLGSMKLEVQPRNGRNSRSGKKRTKKIKLFPWEKGYN